MDGWKELKAEFIKNERQGPFFSSVDIVRYRVFSVQENCIFF